MLRSKLICVVGLLLLVAGLMANQASAQAIFGSILGTVTDPQGAAVVGATVTVISAEKNTTTTAVTNESGNYSVTHLIPDVYTVRIEAKGFKAIEQKGVIVQADNGTRLDGQVTLGGTSETVEVTAESPQLKTDREDVAVELSTKQVEDLPVLNRNFQSMELLTPGTQTITGWAHAATENPQGSKQIMVDGQTFSGTGYVLDGTDNQDAILGIIVVNPSIDTVNEVKMTTANYDAEFGKATAGIMSAQTKSGGNAFHGSGYFYDLDPKGPAKDPFTGAPAPNKWDQFGGAVGGAIIKNKLFFFGGIEANRRTSGPTFTISVPTALMRSTCLAPVSNTNTYCDLSDYSNANLGGGAGAVFNPYQPAGSRDTYTTGAPGSYVTQIPFTVLQQWDPQGVAESFLSQLPAPNITGNNGGTTENYAASGSGSFNDYQYTFRIDHNTTEKLQIFGRYSHAHFLLSGKPVFGDTIGGPGLGYIGLAGQSNINNYSLATGFNYTFSGTLLTDFRFGYFRYNPHATKFDSTSTNAASNLGFYGLNTSDPTTNGLPALIWDQTIGNTGGPGGGSNGLGEGLNIGRCNCPLIEREQQYQFTNNWTKIIGNHQFKVGADLRHANNLRVPSDANRTGILNFNHEGTGNGISGPLESGGLDVATFLFGEATSFNRYVGTPGEVNAIELQNRYFLYAQDTYRASHKLTINYGMRWEYYSPEAVNAKGNGGFAELPEGVIRVAGYGGINNEGNTHGNLHNFAPRFGVAYEMNPKTVVRMGYGRSFDIGVFGSNFGHTVTQNLPVLVNQTLQDLNQDNLTAAFDFAAQAGNTAPVCLPTASGYAAGVCGPTPYAFPVIPANGILPLFGPTVSASPHIRPDRVVVPTVDAWNFTLQRQLTSKMTVEAAYVGTHGTHVFKGTGPTYNINQATVVGFAQGLTYAQRSPYDTAFITPYTDGSGNTTNVVCCGGNSMGYAGNDGANDYNAFQVKVNQRVGNGLTFLAHYTYSKSYDNDGSYQPDLRQGWGRSDFNRDSVFVFAPIYELPFGRGKSYLGDISRLADEVIGGWQWNTSLNISSGLPWSPSYDLCNSDRDTGPCRPNLTGGFSDGVHRIDGVLTYFTPVAEMTTNGATSGPFSRPQIGTFGDVHRNAFTGPGKFQADMSLFKNFAITEGVKAQFQAEFFNVFNHPVYGFNSSQSGSGLCIDCGGVANGGTVASGNGVINATETDVPMRQFQLGVRVTF